jgi:Tfp pilus assembly protein PilW
MSRTRQAEAGFTIVEIMIAVLIATLMMTFILGLMRAQLSSYSQQAEVVEVQQNVRSGFAYLEYVLRQACGGVSTGKIYDRATNPGTSTQMACFQITDGATSTDGITFTANGNHGPDVVKLIYADGTANTSVCNPTSSGNDLWVVDKTGFAVGDLVLVGDFTTAYLLKITAIAASSNTSCPWKISVGLSSSASSVLSALAAWSNAGWLMMHSQAIAIFQNGDATTPQLMVNPDITSTTSNAAPLVEGAEDFEVAVWVDADSNGYILDTSSTSEWQGDAINTTITMPGAANTIDPSVKALRVSLLVRTSAQYAGSTTTGSLKLENRGVSTLTYNGTTVAPRYRELRMVVAPRQWSLANQ